VADATDDLIDHRQGGQKPFTRSNRFPESVCYFNVEPDGIEDPLAQSSEIRSIEVAKPAGRHHIDVCYHLSSMFISS